MEQSRAYRYFLPVAFVISEEQLSKHSLNTQNSYSARIGLQKSKKEYIVAFIGPILTRVDITKDHVDLLGAINIRL